MSSEVRLIENWRERWEPVEGRDVIAVADTPNGTRVWVRHGDEVYAYHAKYALLEKPQPKKLRPWKREEVPVGSVVMDRDGNAISVIGCIDNSIAFINVTGVGWRTPDRLLSDFVLHTTSPDGTWIPTEQCPKCGVEE